MYSDIIIASYNNLCSYFSVIPLQKSQIYYEFTHVCHIFATPCACDYISYLHACTTHAHHICYITDAQQD